MSGRNARFDASAAHRLTFNISFLPFTYENVLTEISQD